MSRTENFEKLQRDENKVFRPNIVKFCNIEIRLPGFRLFVIFFTLKIIIIIIRNLKVMRKFGWEIKDFEWYGLILKIEHRTFSIQL